jgi:hypothetical protein
MVRLTLDDGINAFYEETKKISEWIYFWTLVGDKPEDSGGENKESLRILWRRRFYEIINAACLDFLSEFKIPQSRLTVIDGHSLKIILEITD